MTEHERVQEAAAELALGLLSGPERADALAHMDGCGACRTTVEELSDVADRMLLLAPETEPPPGFETGVLTRIDGKEPRRQRGPRGRRAVLAVAAVVAFVLGGVAGALVFGDRQSRYDREYIAALRQLDGRALAAGRVHVPNGDQVGQLFLYEGVTSWLFVTIDDPRAHGDAELGVELRFEDGRRVVISGLHLVDGSGSLGSTAELRLRDLDGVRVVDADGRSRYEIERVR